ncbi:MAG: hypothetical protein AAF580_00270 [Pseudomonadota bacterium]
MSPFDWPRVLVLPADLTFAHLVERLAALGFQLARVGGVGPPLIDGEPEVTSFAFGGGLPILTYGFNAVVRLRTLDVDTAPPATRAAIAAATAAVEPLALPNALESDDERLRLWGIFAAREAERTDLIAALTEQRVRERGLVLEELDNTLYALTAMADAAVQLLTAERAIAAVGLEVVQAMASADVVAALAPDDAAFDAMFHHTVAAPMRAAYGARPPLSGALKALPQTMDDVSAGSAAALRLPGPISRPFPRGYRTIAGWLSPDSVWLSWRGREADGGERLMDGLCFVGGRWAFVPKPYRDLEPLLPAGLLPAPGS